MFRRSPGSRQLLPHIAGKVLVSVFPAPQRMIQPFFRVLKDHAGEFLGNLQFLTGTV